MATQVQSQSEPIPIKCTLNLAGISIPDTVYYSDTITYMIYFILPDRCTNLSSIETEVLGREVKHQLFCTRPNNPCPDVTKEGLIGEKFIPQQIGKHLFTFYLGKKLIELKEVIVISTK